MTQPNLSPGARFHAALDAERPLQLAGVINAYAALLARRAGFRALYLSGAGVANASFGLPDLGLTTLDEVAEDARRITNACDLPLLADMDTGWGGAFMIARAIKTLSGAGVAAVHIEDQVQAKRCGHRPGKALVAAAEMADRIKAAVDARADPAFAIVARTDAIAVEGVDAALDRACRYQDAGADIVFAEAVTDLADYRRFVAALSVPVLANMTEFGVTPLFTTAQLAEAGVRLVIYPLSAFRAMSAAALRVYETIRRDGTQRALVETMQTRTDLYAMLDYHAYEATLDRLFAREAEDKPSDPTSAPDSGGAA